eukprot:gene20324-28775_t
MTTYFNSSCGASAIWFAPSGKVYVADLGDYVVREISNDLTTFAGQVKIKSTNALSANGDGSAATAATFALPWFVITDTSNNVYVADDDNNKIRKIDPSGIITNFAGTGISGYSGDGGAATAANLAAPKDMWIDTNSVMYFAGTKNHRIRKIDLSTSIITTIAGTGIAPNSGGYGGDNGPAIACQLRQPRS